MQGEAGPLKLRGASSSRRTARPIIAIPITAIPLTVVIPAFNEADRLPSTLATLTDRLDDLAGTDWEIVVSDDGSTDGTLAVVDAVAAREPRVRRVAASQHRGKGAAMAAGIAAARHDAVVLLDADLPVPPAQVVEMAAALDNADLVAGSRCVPGSVMATPQPWSRRIGGRAFRLVVRGLGFGTASDPQCGVKALRRDSVGPVIATIRTPGFAFDVELLERCRRAGLVVRDHPVSWRHVEGSSLRPVRDAVSTLESLVRLRARLGGARLDSPDVRPEP